MHKSITKKKLRRYKKRKSKSKRINLHKKYIGGNPIIHNIYISEQSNDSKLGDSLFVMVYLYSIKDYLEKNNIQINFYIRSKFLNDIKEFSSKNINFFDIDNKPDDAINAWIGYDQPEVLLVFDKQSCWMSFLSKTLTNIGKQMNLPPMDNFTYTDPDLLDRYNSLDKKYKNIDILIINGRPFTNQIEYNKDEWDSFIKKLSSSYNIVTTDKVDTIKSTRDDNLSVKNIAAISTHAKYIIAINTGPMVACLNTYALKNVKKWYIFDKNVSYMRANFVMNKTFDEILSELIVKL